MKKRIHPSNMLVAVDVGTTKIGVLVARQTDEFGCEVIGIGRAPSHGLARGVVVDIAPAVQAIKLAVAEAEMLADCSIDSVLVGVSGVHVATYQSTGMVPIKHGTIKEHDIARVVASSKTIPLLDDEQILHVFPQQFVIDGKHIVRDPLHMHAVRLECKSHIITGNVTMVKNVVECCQLAGLRVEDVILEPVASAAAVLSKDERELGVGLLDIGGGTADFAIYQKDRLCFTKILPIAGTLFTNDLAICMRLSCEEAERVKHEYGSVYEPIENENIIVRDVDGQSTRSIKRVDVNEVLRARSLELFDALEGIFTEYDIRMLMKTGLVITGGGALLSGLADLAQERLSLPVRVGSPLVESPFRDELSKPLYATGYGLIWHHMNQRIQAAALQHALPLPQRVFWRMKSWIADIF